MKLLLYVESFVRIQLFLAFVVLCFFIAYKKSHIEGFLGFSDYEGDRPIPSVNNMDQKIKDEINLGYADYTLEFDKKVIKEEDNKLLKKKFLHSCPEEPPIDCLRIGFFCKK